MITIEEVKANFDFHHTGSRRGYESRKHEGHVEPYKGRFGEGYVIVRPRYDTSNYVYVDYYIRRENA